jgi:hypothetical protein
MGDKNFSKQAVKNMNTSQFLVCFFAVFWSAFMLLPFLPNIFAIIAFICLVVAAAVLLRFAVKICRNISKLPVDSDKDKEKDKKIAKIWNVIFTVQGVGIGISCAVLGILDLYHYIIPVVVIWVGLHYIPMGFLYKTPVHIAVGVATVLTAAAAMIFSPPAVFLSVACGISAAGGALSAIILGYTIQLMIGYVGKL